MYPTIHRYTRVYSRRIENTDNATMFQSKRKLADKSHGFRVHRGIEKCSDVVIVVYIHVDRRRTGNSRFNFQLANSDVNERANIANAILAESYFVASSANRRFPAQLASGLPPL